MGSFCTVQFLLCHEIPWAVRVSAANSMISFREERGIVLQCSRGKTLFTANVGKYKYFFINLGT